MWEPRYSHHNLVGLQSGIPHTYRSIYGYRLRSEILITGNVWYRVPQSKTWVSGPWSRFPPYLSTARVPRYQMGPGTGGPNAQCSISNNVLSQYRVKTVRPMYIQSVLDIQAHGKLGCVYAVTITAMSILLLRGGNFQVLII